MLAATQFLLRWDAAFVRDIKSIALQTKNASNPILYGFYVRYRHRAGSEYFPLYARKLERKETVVAP